MLPIQQSHQLGTEPLTVLTEEHKLPKEVPECHEGGHDVGLIKSARMTGPWQRQYPMSPEAADRIKGTIKELLEAGVIYPTSLYNTPIYPVKNAGTGKWFRT